MENPAMSGDIIYLFTYETETKKLTRTDVLPKDIFTGLIYVSRYDKQYEDFSPEYMLCETATQQNDTIFYARLPEGSETFVNLQLVIRNIESGKETVFNIFA